MQQNLELKASPIHAGRDAFRILSEIVRTIKRDSAPRDIQ